MLTTFFQVGAPTAFRQVIHQLETGGILYFLTDLLIPLFLIFAIMFAILQRVHIFSTTEKVTATGGATTDRPIPNTKLNATISMLLALFVVVPHIAGKYPVDKNPIIIIKNLLPGGVIILIAILLLMAIITLSAGKTPSVFTWLIALGAAFFLFYIIAAAVFPRMSWGPFKDPGTQVLLIAILIAVLWIWFLIKPPGAAHRKRWGYYYPWENTPRNPDG
jgi:hypothetical protein